MTLQSWTFLFLVLPLSLLCFVSLVRAHRIVPAMVFLIGVSLVFAGSETPEDSILVIGSTLLNYGLASWIRGRSPLDPLRRVGLSIGIAANLGILAYFKYFDYVIDNVNALLGSSYDPASPLFFPAGLSFLTFQQIAFLVDSARETTARHMPPFLDYALFSCFFPKHTAGPILRKDEILPQIRRLGKAVNSAAIMEGLTRFLLGYAEKVVVADSLADYATPLFDAAAAEKPVGLIAAWGGVLAFTFQLYFDFVGYTDMAIGAARMFGLVLPENFMSPYKATSVSDFWRRWHMTLSRFLRDYLYIPLGGNRMGFPRQLINMFITMVLGGLWHGAGWTFVIWGAIHGLYLGFNHAWRRLGCSCSDSVGGILTFLAVVYAWVWFRADTAATAIRLTGALIGREGLWSDQAVHPLRALQQPAAQYSNLASIFGSLNVALTYDRWTIYPADILLSGPVLQACWLMLSAFLIWRFPTVQEWLQRQGSEPETAWSNRRGMLLASIFFLALLASMQQTARTFVYSQF
jgi:alginate O-acetyltransferase complex protein AlgI